MRVKGILFTLSSGLPLGGKPAFNKLSKSGMKFRFVWKKICHADRNSPNFAKFQGNSIKRSKIFYQVVIDYRPGQKR